MRSPWQHSELDDDKELNETTAVVSETGEMMRKDSRAAIGAAATTAAAAEEEEEVNNQQKRFSITSQSSRMKRDSIVSAATAATAAAEATDDDQDDDVQELKKRPSVAEIDNTVTEARRGSAAKPTEEPQKRFSITSQSYQGKRDSIVSAAAAATEEATDDNQDDDVQELKKRPSVAEIDNTVTEARRGSAAKPTEEPRKRFSITSQNYQGKRDSIVSAAAASASEEATEEDQGDDVMELKKRSSVVEIDNTLTESDKARRGSAAKATEEPQKRFSITSQSGQGKRSSIVSEPAADDDGDNEDKTLERLETDKLRPGSQAKAEKEEEEDNDDDDDDDEWMTTIWVSE